MMQKKPTLGRGLADLLGRPASPVAEVSVASRPPQSRLPRAPAPRPGEELAKLPLDLLQRGNYQPRVDMRPGIAAGAGGLHQVAGRRPAHRRAPGGPPGAGESQRYEIIAGERRWRAAQMAGLAQIPAVIRDIPDEAAIAVALIENIQRENLNPLEEARALERLITEFELTHQEAAEAVGRSRASVSNLLRLLELAPEVSEMLERRELEMGHARALLGLTNRRQQVEVAAIIVKKALSVRDTEALVRRLQQAAPAGAAAEAGGRARDPERAAPGAGAGRQARRQGGHQALRGRQGPLVVSYNSLDELDGILAHIR